MSKYYINQGSKRRSKKARISLTGIGGSSMNIEYSEKKVLDVVVPYSDGLTTLLSTVPLGSTKLDANEIRDANLIAVSNTGNQTAVVGMQIPDWTLGSNAKDAKAGANSVVQWLLKPGASIVLPGLTAVCTSTVRTNAANGMFEYGYDNAAKSLSDAEKPMQYHPIDVLTGAGSTVETNTVQNEQISTLVQTDDTGSFNYLDGTGNSGLFGHGGIAGSGTTPAHYVPGSICVRFMDPGYTKFGLNKQNSTTKSGLVANTNYRFKMRLDGGNNQEVLFRTDVSDTTWGTGATGTSVLGKVNAALRTLDPWMDVDDVKLPTPQYTIEHGDVYLRWGSAKKVGIGGNETAATFGAGATADYADVFGVGRWPASATLDGNFQAPLFKELNRTGEMMFDDGFGNLTISGRKVGEVEYNCGTVSFTGATPLSSFEHTATYDSALGGSPYTTLAKTVERENIVQLLLGSSTNIMRDAKLKVIALTI